MPTIHKPQLDHASFPWHEQSDRFHTELEAQRAQILEQSGFNREFGNPGDPPGINEEQEGAAFLLELSGILSQAAAIKMDGGYKPANKIIATLKSIEKDPSLILNAGVEPEALAMVASNYKRAEEELGRFWFDIDRTDDDLPDPQRVRDAASNASTAPDGKYQIVMSRVEAKAWRTDPEKACGSGSAPRQGRL
jgi:hypothetical protein